MAAPAWLIWWKIQRTQAQATKAEGAPRCADDPVCSCDLGGVTTLSQGRSSTSALWTVQGSPQLTPADGTCGICFDGNLADGAKFSSTGVWCGKFTFFLTILL